MLVHPLLLSFSKFMSSASGSSKQEKAEALSQDFLNIFKENGLDKLAAEVGIVQDGVIPAVKNYSQPPLVSHSKKRKVAAADVAAAVAPHSPTSSAKTGVAKKKKRVQRAGTSGKANKGLRHFSMKVCQKVEAKGKTSYNEVADELLQEFAADVLTNPVDQSYDEKNIRRRVYDALNVLMAMDIISKEKKEISWKGLPESTANNTSALRREKETIHKSVERKKRHLEELLLQQVAFKNLVRRNSTQTATHAEETKIPLPFIIVSTKNQTVVQCEMAEDRSDIFFNFDAPFEIHDDNEILKKMKMQHCDPAEATKLVAPRLVKYLPGAQPDLSASE